jgi:hypothetical protein
VKAFEASVGSVNVGWDGTYDDVESVTVSPVVPSLGNAPLNVSVVGTLELTNGSDGDVEESSDRGDVNDGRPLVTGVAVVISGTIVENDVVETASVDARSEVVDAELVKLNEPAGSTAEGIPVVDVTSTILVEGWLDNIAVPERSVVMRHDCGIVSTTTKVALTYIP